jgi:hypothetical protein
MITRKEYEYINEIMQGASSSIFQLTALLEARHLLSDSQSSFFRSLRIALNDWTDNGEGIQVNWGPEKRMNDE